MITLALCFLAASPAISKQVGWHHPAQKLPEQNQDASEKHSPAEPDKRGTLDTPLFIKAIPPEKSPDEAANDAKERDDKRFYDRATVGISFFTLLILCVQAVVFWIQAKRLKETIKAMQKIAMDQSKDMQGWIAVADKSASAARKSADAFAATETAWAMERIINVDFREFLPGTADADQKKVSVEYYVENYGRTPAIITCHFVDVRISDSPPPAEAECFSKEIGNEYQIGVIDSGNNAGPFPCARKAISLTKAQISGLARASLYLWVVGHIYFEDVFGEERSRLFAYRYDSRRRRLIPYKVARQQV